MFLQEPKGLLLILRGQTGFTIVVSTFCFDFSANRQRCNEGPLIESTRAGIIPRMVDDRQTERL